MHSIAVLICARQSQFMNTKANPSADKHMPHYDYTIVGAGASGLWLALALAEEGLLDHRSLCISEKEAAKGNDRTWCYWAKEALVPEEIISKSWSVMRKPHEPGQNTALGPYQYHHIRSADFYTYMRGRLAAYPNITWVNAGVTSVNEVGGSIALSAEGHKWSSSYAFVSAAHGLRINGEEVGSAMRTYLGQNGKSEERLFLWQSFVGWRVKCTEPIFDESSATMMRFDIPQGANTQFMYELPFSEKEALVEMTRFGEGKLELAEAEIELRKYMESRSADYSIEEMEIASIPMSPRYDMKRKQLAPGTRIVFIGAAGGALKPTTGYAFKRMKQYAYHLAKALKAGTSLPTMQRHWRFRLYDRLLLQILQDQPVQGKPVFLRLFSTQKLQRVLKFLDEESSLREELSIFARLQLPLFMGSLWQHLKRR